jgi:hypothetical protein
MVLGFIYKNIFFLYKTKSFYKLPDLLYINAFLRVRILMVQALDMELKKNFLTVQIFQFFEFLKILDTFY